MLRSDHRLRVALLAGTLGQGGAEKQLVYTARALLNSGVGVRVYSLTQGEHYEASLIDLGLQPVWIGQSSSSLSRLLSLVRNLWNSRPHFVQSTHFFTNLYAAAAGRIAGCTSIGSIRSDVYRSLSAYRIWGKYLIESPNVIIANSETARLSAVERGYPADKVYVLPNVIDLEAFDQMARQPTSEVGEVDDFLVISIARMVQAKRLDRFLRVISIARKEVRNIKGILVGDGPLRQDLENLAGELGLVPGGVEFLGQRDDVPALLKHAHLLLLTSDYEGFPNVILEAMAAALPVITTPAGDSGHVVQDGKTGFVVPFDNLEKMAEKLVGFARSEDMQENIGVAGRKRVEQDFQVENLASRTLAIYTEIARKQKNQRILRLLHADHGIS